MRLLKGLACLAAAALLLAACSRDGGNEGQAAPPMAETGEAKQGQPLSEADAGTNPDREDSVNGEEPSKPGGSEMDGSAGQLYAIAFEAMMKLDEALNDEMKYIAVDLSEMSQLTETDKTYIIEYLQSFDTEIRIRTMEELMEEEELQANNLILKGVLLRIAKVEIGESTALIEGSKYRSGSGAIGAKIALKLENGAWKLADSEMTWIS
ncbi:hypothetical protein [Paenibacillus macerans]|uniref:hypothetical protein n=1 Tax=Paenibacillus macerans TaxID=44252 RepID=UPI003D31AB45